MQVVGDYLIREASQITAETDKDLFGRSAFNRYYYAAFLTIRRLFSEVDDNLNEPPHGQIPELLTVTLHRKFKRIINKQERDGFMTTDQAQELRSSVHQALQSLADLMRYAYSIRKVADYQPETKIELSNGLIEIAGCESSVARSWCDEVEVKVNQVCDIWRQLGN